MVNRGHSHGSKMQSDSYREEKWRGSRHSSAEPAKVINQKDFALDDLAKRTEADRHSSLGRDCSSRRGSMVISWRREDCVVLEGSSPPP